MKRLLRIGIVSLGAAVVLFAAFHYMRAQGETSSSVVEAPEALSADKRADSPTQAVPHTLLTTYFTQAGTMTTPLTMAEGAEDYLAVDNPTTFKCQFPKGCTLEIEQSMQVGEGPNVNANYWAPLVYVDGTMLSYTPWVGEVPPLTNYVLATSNQSTAVTPGKHTVQSYVWSDSGLTVRFYHITYRVYVP
ncbi:MAG: hypothetical protein ACLQVM_09925 [Terriglobia bacterium]